MERRISLLEKKVDELTKIVHEIKKGQDTLITYTKQKVQFCEQEIEVNVHLADLKKDEQAMIVDSGNPSTLGGRPSIEEYLRVNEIRKEDLNSRSCAMVFIFGDTKYKSEEIIDIPVKLEVKGGNSRVMYIPTYIVEGNVPFLLGDNTMREWRATINTFDRTLEVYMYDEKNPVEFLAPKIGNHMKLQLESSE